MVFDFLCLSHIASLDNITRVTKFIRSMSHDLCEVKGIDKLTVKRLNMFYMYRRIIPLLLYQNDVMVNSGLISLYIDRHDFETIVRPC